MSYRTVITIIIIVIIIIIMVVTVMVIGGVDLPGILRRWRQMFFCPSSWDPIEALRLLVP